MLRGGQFFNQLFEAQSGRGFLWLPVFVAIGVSVYFSLKAEPPILLAVLFLLGAGAALKYFWRDVRFHWVFVYLFMIALGFGSAQFRAHMVYTPILAKKVQPVELEGRVSFIERVDDGQRIILSDIHANKIDEALFPKKVRIKFRRVQDGVQVGHRIKLLAGLAPPSPPVMPYGFDFQRHMYFSSIGASGFAYGDAQIIGGQANWSISGFRDDVNARIYDALDAVPIASIAAALMTGQRGAIDEADAAAMRDSGLAHMLAISGLHIGLVSGLVFFILRFALSLIQPIALYYPIKKYAAIGGIFAACFYMLIAGASVPTQRATIMCVLVFTAIVFDRFSISMRLVSFAALCVLLIAPESLLGVSFQMSFAAVASLIAFYEYTRSWWAAQHRQGGVLRRAILYLVGICATSVVATLSTAPFALYHFQTLGWYSVISNLLAMPILSFWVMPSALLSYLAMPFGLESYTLWLMGQGIDAILAIAHHIANLKGAVLHVKQLPLVVLLCFSFALIGMLLLNGYARAVSVFFIFAGVVSIYLSQTAFMYVSGNGAKLAAYYDEDHHSFTISSGKAERFVRQNWQRSLGYSSDYWSRTWPKEGVQDNVVCAEQGCRISHRGYVVDYLYNIPALAESCEQVDLVILQVPVSEYPKACRNIPAYDLFKSYREGALALYIRKGRIEMVMSEDVRGMRLWSARYQNAQSVD